MIQDVTYQVKIWLEQVLLTIPRGGVCIVVFAVCFLFKMKKAVCDSIIDHLVRHRTDLMIFHLTLGNFSLVLPLATLKKACAFDARI